VSSHILLVVIISVLNDFSLVFTPKEQAYGSAARDGYQPRDTDEQSNQGER
jgi:hypothetical protein